MKRMFSLHLGSSRSTVSASSEDRTRYYDFVDSPAHLKPKPSLIERQQLTAIEESQLRQACRLLYESVARGEASSVQPDHKNSKADSRLTRTYNEPSLLACWNPPAEDHHLSLGGIHKDLLVGQRKDTVNAERSGPDSHDTPTHLVKGDGEGAVTLPEDTHGSDETTANIRIGRSCIAELEGTMGAIDTTFPHQLELTELSEDHRTRPNSSQLDAGADEALTRESNSYLDYSTLDYNYPVDNPIRPSTRANMDSLRHSKEWTDSAPLPARVPSFTLPRVASRPVSKQTPKDCNDASYEKGEETAEDASSGRRRYSWQSSEVPQIHGGNHTIYELQIGDQSQASDERGIAVIIDTDGMERIMTATEEKERHLDLQRAVMEKMFTGTIGANPGTISNHDTVEGVSKNINWMRAPDQSEIRAMERSGRDSPNSDAGGVKKQNSLEIPFHPAREKQSTLIRKLAILSFGKKENGKSAGTPIWYESLKLPSTLFQPRTAGIRDSVR